MSTKPLLDEAKDIRPDASQFSKNLSATDTTVQKALETLDKMSAGGVPEAPSDGKQYVRKNADWEEVSIPAAVSDTELPKFTVDGGTGLIQDDGTDKYFWIAPWAGSIKAWRIWSTDNLAKTIQTTVKKNGTTIGQDIDLTAQADNSGTCAVSFAAGDKFSFIVDANTDARKIIVQLLAEKS